MHPTTTRRRFLGQAALAGTAVILGAAARRTGAEQPPNRDIWPMYTFDYGLRSVPAIEDKVKLLKDLGYAGVALHLHHVPLEMVGGPGQARPCPERRVHDAVDREADGAETACVGAPDEGPAHAD